MDTSGPEHCMPANTLNGFGHYTRIHLLTPKSKLNYLVLLPQRRGGKTRCAVTRTYLTKLFEPLLYQEFVEPNQISYGM